MAATFLKTNYQDYIPPSTGKRYVITKDAQGYSTIQDATEYTQEGDTFGASDINATNTAVNGITNSAPYSLAAGDSIPEGADLNDYRTAGTYVCPNSATSATILNKPQTNTSLGFKLIVQYNQSQNWFTQFFFVIDQVYVRYYNNTEQAYNQWKLIPAMDPPVYGSNANGYWEKLPGSIMIAWGTKSTGTIQSKSWSDITFNFPLAFSSAPMVIAVPRYDSTVDVTLNVGGSSTSGAWCHVYFGGSGSDAVGINWMAIGSY